MRPALILLPFLALSACSGENQGWNPNYRAEATPYGDYLRARELALTGRTPEPPRVIPMTRPFKAPTATEIAGPSPVQILERDTTQTAHAVGIRPDRALGAVTRTRAPAIDMRPTGRYTVQTGGPTSPVVTPVVVATAPAVVTAPAAVAAAPVAVATPGAPTVVTATPLPPAGADPLIAYASVARQAPGIRTYARSGGSGANCASYATPADAQRAFLAAGGPQRDPLGFDPDGDGYVCGWTPASHRGGAL